MNELQLSAPVFGKSWADPLTADQLATLPRTVLQFSGGKDSLACLYLLESQWPDITVAWMNTGAAFPEVIELMTRIRSTVPHFLEVRADVHRDIARSGWPVDIVPVEATPLGQLTVSGRGLRMRSFMDCCWANFWGPMQRVMAELGVTKIIRGQRKSEAYKAPIQSGHIVDGIEISFPLEDWTADQVITYLQKRGIPLPANYEYMTTSLDCWCCTAYLPLHQGRLAYMKAKHPQLHEKVHQTMKELHEQIDAQTARVRELAAKELAIEPERPQAERTVTLRNGIPVYNFKYKGDDRVRTGVMAQDVLKVMPHAVHLGPDGFYRVDYAMIGAAHLISAQDIADQEMVGPVAVRIARLQQLGYPPNASQPASGAQLIEPSHEQAQGAIVSEDAS